MTSNRGLIYKLPGEGVNTVVLGRRRRRRWGVCGFGFPQNAFAHLGRGEISPVSLETTAYGDDLCVWVGPATPGNLPPSVERPKGRPHLCARCRPTRKYRRYARAVDIVALPDDGPPADALKFLKADPRQKIKHCTDRDEDDKKHSTNSNN